MNPSTTVTLYKTPFDASNRYVIAVDSVSEAYSIVQSYSHLEFTDCYWQRDDFSFRANGNIALLRQYNYCTYINKSRDTRFAFITDYEYVNDDMTLVHIKTDPWMTYAGRLVFNPSPMVRCHPKDNSYAECNRFSESLDLTFQRIDEEFFNDDDVDASDDDVIILASNSLSVATGYNINSDLTPDGRFTTPQIRVKIAMLRAWESYISSGSLSSSNLVWSPGLYTPPDPKRVDNYVENLNDFYDYTYKPVGTVVKMGNVSMAMPGMYCLSLTYTKEIINLLNSFGRLNDVLDTYKIPDFLRPAEFGPHDSNLLAPTITAKEITKTFTLRKPNGLNWLKSKLSPQFHRFNVYCCGDEKEIPWDLMDDVGDPIPGSFNIFVNPLPNGGLIVTTTLNGFNYGAEFAVTSPSWDKVSLNGFSLSVAGMSDLNSSIRMTRATAAFNNIRSLNNGLVGLATSVATGNAIGAAKAVIGLHRDEIINKRQAGSGIASAVRSAMDTQQNQTYAMGGVCSTIASYIHNGGMIRLSYFRLDPKSQRAVETIFGTYGYNQGGLVKEIVFKQLPKWHYYQTSAACIEGDDVPQSDLNDVINMFNSGVFVFTSKDTYKKFEDVLSNHY